jgi:NADPH:quinone reductase-like Zn-dependent oxidoreductase
VALLGANKSVFGVNLGHMWGEQEMVAGWMSTLLDGVDEGWVRPHVDRAFAFDDARDAHAYIEDRRSTGKVVLTT